MAAGLPPPAGTRRTEFPFLGTPAGFPKRGTGIRTPKGGRAGYFPCFLSTMNFAICSAASFASAKLR